MANRGVQIQGLKIDPHPNSVPVPTYACKSHFFSSNTVFQEYSLTGGWPAEWGGNIPVPGRAAYGLKGCWPGGPGGYIPGWFGPGGGGVIRGVIPGAAPGELAARSSSPFFFLGPFSRFRWAESTIFRISSSAIGRRSSRHSSWIV